MLNRAEIIGRLGQDPEVRYTSNGDAVCNFSVATTEKWKDKESGELNEETTWHRVSAWGPQAEILVKYMRKGSLIYLDGKMTQRKYTDKDGLERTSHEIRMSDFKMLGSRSDNQGDQQSSAPAPQRRPAAPAARPARQAPTGGGGGFDDMDDDIPFATPHAVHDPMFTSRKASRIKDAR